MSSPKTVHIIGAGPAGLTAARELALNGIKPIVYEMTDAVGGISRTEDYKGYYFDIGGHRFYTKVTEIEALWQEVLGDAFIDRPRLSRIYYDGKFYNYPLNLVNVLTNLGIVESIRSAFSYVYARLFPKKPEVTFEDWVSNRFGKRLFDRFFRTYTEKVWGIPVNKIRADWASQRIKDLSFWSAVQSALMGARKNGEIKTLITQFQYPIQGPGMMWEAFRKEVERLGGEVIMNTKVLSVDVDDWCVRTIQIEREDGTVESIPVEHVISSMPLKKLIMNMEPAVPANVHEAAENLQYRDFLVVCLIVDEAELFPDNWLYIHSPEVKVGRIQNFKNWSEAMVPDQSKSSLGMEYFCNVGDELWQMADADLIALASKELDKVGIAPSARVIDGTVIRQPKAYPVYAIDYLQHVFIIRDYIKQIENLQTIGRNGLHRYNNQDHSMLTGLLAARNVISEQNDLWDVNTERSYYESVVVSKSQ